MFANVETTLVPTVFSKMQEMENSEFEFFLTGSRFFGGVHEGSDYDFFVCGTEEVGKYLLDNGFFLDGENSYQGDPTFSHVYTFKDWSGQVQVQLIHPKEFSRKQLIQRLLMSKYQGKGLPGDKNQKRELWRLTYHTLCELGIH
jgi:hypothetical protein